MFKFSPELIQLLFKTFQVKVLLSENDAFAESSPVKLKVSNVKSIGIDWVTVFVFWKICKLEIQVENISFQNESRATILYYIIWTPKVRCIQYFIEFSTKYGVVRT